MILEDNGDAFVMSVIKSPPPHCPSLLLFIPNVHVISTPYTANISTSAAEPPLDAPILTVNMLNNSYYAKQQCGCK